MNTLKRGLVFVVLALCARLMPAAAAPVPAPANPSPPPTAVPAIGVWLVPAGDVFKFWADYRQSISMEAGKDKIRLIINSMDTVIRRADTGQPVARIPYQGVIGGALDDERAGHAEFVADTNSQDSRSSTFPDDRLQALAKNPPGDYLLAVYVNGVRASNVVKIRIDPAFDAAKAPTLELGPIEPPPRAPFGQVVLWAIGPTPPDPGLIDYYLANALLVADGVQQRLPSMDRGQGGPSPSGYRGRGISGPPPRGLQFLHRRPLVSGERMAVLLRLDVGSLGNYTPAFDFSVPHTYALTYYLKEGHGNPGDAGSYVVESRHYDAAPLTFIPMARPLGDAWDQASPPGESRPIAPPADSSAAGSALGPATGVAAGFPALAASSPARPTPTPAMVTSSDAINAALRQTMSVMNFSDTTLDQAISVLSQLMSVKLAIAPDAAARVRDLHFNLNIHNGTMAQTLDQLCAATGLVYAIEGDTIVFHAAPPKPVITNAALQSVVNKYAFLSPYNPLHPQEIAPPFRIQPYLAVAAALQAMPRDQALAQLRAWAAMPNRQYSEQVRNLCGLLWTGKDGENLRGPLIGEPSYIGGTTSSDWPNTPFTFIGAIPFMIVNGSSGAGRTEDPSHYLVYCEA